MNYFIGVGPGAADLTPVGGAPAAESWAGKNDCAIENPAAIQAVSAAALAERQVGAAITEREMEAPSPVTLALGAGCRRGMEPQAFEDSALSFLRACGVSPLSIRCLATIDRKKEERAFLAFCEKYRLPLIAYSAEELRQVPGLFAHSDFVERTVGVDNVCERAAVKASGGALLAGKTKMPGVTFALAGEESV